MESSGLPPAAPDTPETPAPEATATEPEAAAAPDKPTEATPSQMDQLLAMQREQREEIQSLHAAIAANKPSPVAPAPSAQALSTEDARQARLDELANVDFYCPACGRVYEYLRECTGTPEQPHAPTLVVSTDEVRNPPDPNADPAAHAEWQQGHTAAPATGP